MQLERAVALLEAGDIESGLEALGAVEENHPDDPVIALQLVNIYHELGHHDAALAILERMEGTRGGRDAEMQREMSVYRASLYIDLDRLQEAMDVLLPIKEAGTDDYRVYALLGELFLIDGLTEVAIHYFEQAVELAPDNEEIQYLLGRLYAEEGQSERAIAKWELLEGFEDKAPILLERARLAAHQGDFESALTLYEKAEGDEGNTEALYGAGMMAYQLGDWQRTVRHLARLIEKDADYISAYALLAEALWKLNMKEQAAVIYQRALAIHAEEEKLLQGYVRVVIELRKWEEAEATLAKLREIDEEDPSYYYWQGRMAEAQGRARDALACYEQSLASGEAVADAQQRYQNLIKH
ncbi:tetratricopeptide repeat protein [Aneurinibacillus sp. BA2021]|nr:tetratricopeptide repeat protein [Aneurinibacillus sp. BA2021]